MDQLKKSISTLKDSFDLTDEFKGYELLCNMNLRSLFNEGINQNNTYRNKCIELVKLYLTSNFYRYFRFPMDAMMYFISLYWIDRIRKKIMRICRKGYNGLINVNELNSIFGINLISTFEAFYYTIENDLVDMKIKNTKNREIDRIFPNLYNSNIYLYKGNVDFQMYYKVTANYIKNIIKGKRVIEVYKKIVFYYIHDQELKVVRSNENKEKRKKVKESDIIKEKVSFLNEIVKLYLKFLIYKLIKEKYIYRLISPDLFSIIYVYEDSRIFKHLVKTNKYVIDSIGLYNFTKFFGCNYNLVVFFSNNITKLRNKYHMLNIQFNTQEFYKYFHYKKVKLVLLNNLSYEQQIDWVVSELKYDKGLYQLLEDLLDGKECPKISVVLKSQI
ncbi:hypothetical protein A0H76_2563 [Hepatospora eriocheir]|uniref:Uncharacterized protein n=1 Tax=Hepatospora eriocheir TaxID=1081669 RepID=A0A1X0QJV4_9MICR|nr:hypothetical protein A0H76_2563 [Hepatospora eriocheir]